MRLGIYTDSEEEKIFTRREAKAWARSGLITEAQLEFINERTAQGLNQTNVFFRLLFFLFTCICVTAVVGLYFWLFKVRGTAALAASALFFGALSYALAEFLARRKSFYRYGIEEALALCSVPLVCWGILTALPVPDHSHLWYVASISLLIAAAAFWVYLRFGFLYAAVLSIASASAVPFHLSLPPAAERIVLAAALALILLASIRAEGSETRDFARERSAALQGMLLIGIYAALNLRLHLLGSTFFGDHGMLYDRHAGYPPWFYWATYGLVFVVPALGLWHGIRARKRMVINTSLILFILSLATNKDYLGFRHYAWDPAILGASMIVAAVVLTRWLRSGHGETKNGFTARSLVKPEDHGISLADIGAAAIPGMVGAPPKPPQADRPFEGGMSGGGGASGNY